MQSQFSTLRMVQQKKIVTFAEPPALMSCKKISRLIEVFGQDGSDFVRLMLNQIREKCRDFQTTLSQIKKSKKSDVLSFLDEMLGPLIKPRKAGKPEPPKPSSRIQTIKNPQELCPKMATISRNLILIWVWLTEQIQTP